MISLIHKNILKHRHIFAWRRFDDRKEFSFPNDFFYNPFREIKAF